MVQFLLGSEPPEGSDRGPVARAHACIERGFERLREVYTRTLERLLHRRRLFIGCFAVLCVGSLTLIPLLGQDFFPNVDAGELRMHIRAQPGTRIEETTRLFAQIEDRVRQVVPKTEIDTVIQNIGVPVSGINLVLGDPSMISSADGEMLVALKPTHKPTADYMHSLRRDLSRSFPGTTFFFLPADISSQVLSFGQSAPIDVRLTGPARNEQANLTLARGLMPMDHVHIP